MGAEGAAPELTIRKTNRAIEIRVRIVIPIGPVNQARKPLGFGLSTPFKGILFFLPSNLLRPFTPLLTMPFGLLLEIGEELPAWDEL